MSWPASPCFCWGASGGGGWGGWGATSPPGGRPFLPVGGWGPGNPGRRRRRGSGLGRYSASCWPAFLPLGVLVSRKPWLQAPLVGVFALFQGIFAYLFIHQFEVL